MAGCFDIRAAVFLYVSDGTQVTAPYPNDFVPYSVTAEYEPSKQVWSVSNESFLTAGAGAPTCPPSHA